MGQERLKTLFYPINPTSLPPAPRGVKIDGLRLVGGNSSPTRQGTATTTNASTTGSKPTYTLAGDSSPDTSP